MEKLADYVLQVGLAGARLRPLAAAVGTSDRMLLYYFKDKDELMEATLGCLANRLLDLLNCVSPTPKPFAVLLPAVCKMMRSPSLKEYTSLWLELGARSARLEEPYAKIAGQISDQLLAWVACRLLVNNEEDRNALAALLFSTVEGIVFVEGLGQPQIADQAIQGAARLFS